MKNQFLIFVNVLFSIFALKSVNGQLRRRASNNDSNININSNSNENIGSIDPCKGLCKNGSTCMEGIAQSPSKFRSSVGYGDGDDRAYHCECPYGWTGVRCDIVYESCSLESSPSESTPHYQHECYNNGKCVPGKFDDYGHEQLFCDCSDAFDEDGNMYAGKYCEHQVVDYCSDEENFCLNGAICNKDYPEFGGPCMCRGDFEGLHCESRKNSVPKSAQIIMQNAPNLAPQCDLTCLNGGYCVMHTSVRIEDGESEGNNLNTDVIDRISKYCTCLTGYDGPTCEIEKEEEDPVSINDSSSTLDSPSFHDPSQNSFTTVAKIDTETGKEISSNRITVITKEEVDLEKSKCGDGYCAHGSVCVGSSIGDKDSYCDCDTVTTNDASFAGRFCQYEATSYCAKNPSTNQHLFCVNDGSCKKDMLDNSNGSVGCDCKNGFMGFNCQMTTEEFNASTLTPYDIDSSTGDEEESNVDLQLINENQRYEDDTKHLSAEGTLDHLDQSVSTPSSPLQVEEEEEIAETLEENENDATENISKTLEVSGDQSTLSALSNEPPLNDNKKSDLAPLIVDNPTYIIKCDNSKCMNGSSSPSDSSNSKFNILSRFFIVVGSLVLVLMMIAYVKKRQQCRKCAKEMKSFLTNKNSNNAHFTENPLLQTPDNSINLAPKQDYNYDGIPLRLPSVTAITNTHYQPDPVDMIIDSMGKGKDIGMESSDSTPETNQYITGRNRRGENNNHQIL